MKSLALLFILTLSQSHASDDANEGNAVSRIPRSEIDSIERNELPAEISERIEDTLKRISQIQPNASYDAAAAGLTGSGRSAKCESTYNDLYKGDVINIDFVQGYQDTHPFVEDKRRTEILKKRMMSPCPAKDHLCDFKQDPKDLNVVVKTISGPSGEPKMVRVRLTDSAYTSVHVDNVVERNRAGWTKTPEQKAKSERARKTFADGLKNSDVVIYVGHARGGSGPGFEPAHTVTNQKTGRVGWNLDYHRANPVTRTEMLSILATRRPPLKMLGLFACYADRDFAQSGKGYRGARELSPETSIAATREKVSLRALFDQGVAMLDSVLEMRCEPELKTALTATVDLSNGKLETATAEIGDFVKMKKGSIVSNESGLNTSAKYRSSGGLYRSSDEWVRPGGTAISPASSPGSSRESTAVPESQGAKQ